MNTKRKLVDTWYRKILDREKDAIICKEIWQELHRITRNTSKPGKEGGRVGVYEMHVFTLSPKPKTAQRERTEHKKRLLSKIIKSEKELEKFKDKEVAVYICTYLRKEKFHGYDVDNLAKIVLDALKEVIGDDSNVTTLVTEKKQLANYPTEDLDFFEQALVVVSEPRGKSQFLKEVGA